MRSRGQSPQRSGTRTPFVGLAVGLVAALLVAGCGGGGSTPVPEAPQITSMVPGDHTITVQWDPVPYADTYTLMWSDDPDPVATGTAIEDIDATTYTHGGLDNGQTCYCVVIAVNNEDKASPPSAVQSVALRPDPTVILSVTREDGTARIQWQAVPYATSYRLYWDDESPAFPIGNQVDQILGLQYALPGLQPATTYFFNVTVVGNGGESEAAVEKSITFPPAPPAMVAVTAGDAQNEISWADVEGATSYTLYWGNDPGVTPQTGTAIADLVETDYLHDNLTNSTAYYYVITATGAGGESAASAEVSGMPLARPGIPLNPTVVITEESPGSLTVSWSAPDTGADSYRLYWDTEAGVDTTDTMIDDVTSPFVHTGLPGRVPHYYRVAAILNGFESDLSAEVSATPRGPPSGGGHDEGFGNNLAMPVIFADGYGLGGDKIDGTIDPWLDFATGVRPTSTDTVDPFPYWDADDIFVLNGANYYQQKGASTWQAEWRDGSGADQNVVVDWGDNLSSVNYSADSVIRVETTLYQEDENDPMKAFTMEHLFGSGMTEMWGTDGTTYDSARRHVYTVGARLRIEKLVSKGGPVDEDVEGIDLSVADGFAGDGPGFYAAENNVSGKIVYGYVWMLKNWPLDRNDKIGWWRITFLMDEEVKIQDETVTNRTFLDALDPGEQKAVLDRPNNRTWIEIQINNSRSGTGGGGGKGGGGGGSH